MTLDVLEKINIWKIEIQDDKVGEYINKNGLRVGTSSRELFEELMRGTGFVMGSNISLYIENAGLHDKNIVVSRYVDSKNSVEIKKFPANKFQNAFDLFTSWSSK